MESCERFWAFWTSFWEVFLWEPSSEASLNFSGGQSVQQSARLHRVCHLLPQEVDAQREQKGWKKSRQQLQVGPWANRYQRIYKPLALFSAVFYWVSLGCISVPLQKWILEVDGANQLAAGFAQKLRWKRGRCLFLLWNLSGCIFGFHVHFLRVCMIFDLLLFFFTSRLFWQLNPP